MRPFPASLALVFTPRKVSRRREPFEVLWIKSYFMICCSQPGVRFAPRPSAERVASVLQLLRPGHCGWQ
jgi:hypothetical protein